MKPFIGLLLVFGLLLPSFARADNGVNWDHFGTSFVLTTVMYGFYKGPISFQKPDALILGLATSLILSSVYEFTSSVDNKRPISTNKLFWNAVGAGVSVGTTVMFNF